MLPSSSCEKKKRLPAELETKWKYNYVANSETHRSWERRYSGIETTGIQSSETSEQLSFKVDFTLSLALGISRKASQLVSFFPRCKLTLVARQETAFKFAYEFDHNQVSNEYGKILKTAKEYIMCWSAVSLLLVSREILLNFGIKSTLCFNSGVDLSLNQISSILAKPFCCYRPSNFQTNK